MTEIVATWLGDHFVPLKRYEKLANEQFVVGDRYVMQIGSQISASKRAMFHATLQDIYVNLPDDIAANYLDKEHFRKCLTIGCGFATEVQFVAASKAEAMRLAAALRTTDAYSVVQVKDAVVTQWRAKSTSARAMDGREFSALVDAVLAKAGDLVGVEPKALRDFNRTHRDKADKQIHESNATGPCDDGRITDPELLTRTRGRGLGAGTEPSHRESTNHQLRGDDVDKTPQSPLARCDNVRNERPDGESPPSGRPRENIPGSLGGSQEARSVSVPNEMADDGGPSPVPSSASPPSELRESPLPEATAGSPDGSSSFPSAADPAKRRKLTCAEAIAILPMSLKIRTALMVRGALLYADWPREDVISELNIATTIALSDKAPGCKLGMQDRNGRVVYFAVKT